MAVGDAIKARRTTRYRVEIRHPGGEWNHIHPPAWEQHEQLTEVRPYADAVRVDHPDSEVRIMATDTTEITKFPGGEHSCWVDRGAAVQTYL